MKDKTVFSFFINFKTYPKGTGKWAVKLAKVCAEVGFSEKVTIVPIVQAVDIFPITQVVDIDCWVQHLDWQKPGRATGWINLEAAICAGASGTLLNHSERHLAPGTIKQTLKRVRDIDKGFGTMVCGGTLGQVEKLTFTKPDYIAYEVKELIAGQVSITNCRPKSVKKAILLTRKRKIPLIVGAGINSAEDVLLAKKLGALGVLISSAVVLANNPKKKLLELVGGIKK